MAGAGYWPAAKRLRLLALLQGHPAGGAGDGAPAVELATLASPFRPGTCRVTHQSAGTVPGWWQHAPVFTVVGFLVRRTPVGVVFMGWCVVRAGCGWCSLSGILTRDAACGGTGPAGLRS